jgi:hypothetical protein
MRKKSDKQRKADRAFRRRLRREQDKKIDAFRTKVMMPFVPVAVVLLKAQLAGETPIELAKQLYPGDQDILTKIMLMTDK